MTYVDISVEQRGAVSWVYFDRPAVMNEMRTRTLRELGQVFSDLAGRESVRVVVLSGRGRAFCAGADLKSADGQVGDTKSVQEFLREAELMERALADVGKPVIAAINGVCCGGGLEVALACDFIVAAKSAKIGSAHIKAGVIPCGGATARLTRLIGENAAKYLLFTGILLTAEESLRTGLIQCISADDALEIDVQSIADSIAENSPLGIRHMKTLLSNATDMSLEEAIRAERSAAAAYGASYDAQEGKRAFVERRKSEYRGC